MKNNNGGARPKEQRPQKEKKRKHSSSTDKVHKKSSHHKHSEKSEAKINAQSTTAVSMSATSANDTPLPAGQPGIIAAFAAKQPPTTTMSVTTIDTDTSDGEEDSTMLANSLASTHLTPTSSAAQTLADSLGGTHITPPQERRALKITEIITEKQGRHKTHVDTPRPPPDLPIPHLPVGKRATDTNLCMKSPLATSSGDGCTASYTQQLHPGGAQYPAAPLPRIQDSLTKYFQNQENKKKVGGTGTQTSCHPLTFKDTTDEVQPAFHILPQALGIWRQSRGCFVTSEKCKVRAAKLRDWAEEGLVVPWAVGTSRTPYHYLPKDPATIQHLGERLTIQALDNMKIHAQGIQLEADLKAAQAQALYKSLEAMYDEDPEELLHITDIIARMVSKDHHLALTQANKTEAYMRANPLKPRDVYNLRYPPIPTTTTDNTSARGRRGRSKSSGRSPRQQAPRKRQRGNSRDNKRCRSNSRRPQRRNHNNDNKTSEQKMFSRFQAFLKYDHK